MRKTNEFKRRWSDSQKLEAAKAWLICGNLAQTAASLNIPLVTLKSWRYSSWWDDMIADLKTESSLKLNNRLKNIATKSLDLLEDRLQNGDYIFNQKTGELIRKPVVAREINAVARTSLEAVRQMEKDEIYKVNQEKQQSQLELLAERFEAFAKKIKPVQVTDVIYHEVERTGSNMLSMSDVSKLESVQLEEIEEIPVEHENPSIKTA